MCGIAVALAGCGGAAQRHCDLVGSSQTLTLRVSRTVLRVPVGTVVRVVGVLDDKSTTVPRVYGRSVCEGRSSQTPSGQGQVLVRARAPGVTDFFAGSPAHPNGHENQVALSGKLVVGR